MNYEQLDSLEEKINKAIRVINNLQAENEELKKYNMELINKVQENEKTIQRLREEYQNLKDHQDISHITKEKEEEIRHKVEGMLAKLDSLQHISSI